MNRDDYAGYGAYLFLGAQVARTRGALAKRQKFWRVPLVAGLAWQGKALTFRLVVDYSDSAHLALRQDGRARRAYRRFRLVTADGRRLNFVGTVSRWAWEPIEEWREVAASVTLTTFNPTEETIMRKWKIYRDKAGKYRVRGKASNGKVVFTSSQGYHRKIDAARNAIKDGGGPAWLRAATVGAEFSS